MNLNSLDYSSERIMPKPPNVLSRFSSSAVIRRSVVIKPKLRRIAKALSLARRIEEPLTTRRKNTSEPILFFTTIRSPPSEERKREAYNFIVLCKLYQVMKAYF